MRGMIRFAVSMFWVYSVFLTAGSAQALTPEQVVSLKNAGVSDQTIQLMIRQEREAAAGSPDDSPGRRETINKEGKSVIIYSTGRPSGVNRGREEQQAEKAWEMLNNVIIDTRKPR